MSLCYIFVRNKNYRCIGVAGILIIFVQIANFSCFFFFTSDKVTSVRVNIF
jgi:hypothetical protein